MARLTRVITGGYISGFRPEPVATPTVTVPFTETWTGADNPNALDGDFLWNDFIGTHQWSRVSNTARLFGATSVAQGGYLNNNCGTDDVAVTLTYPVYSPGTNTLSAGPLVRMSGTVNFTGYCATVVSSGGASNLMLLRFLAGVQTQLPAGQPISIPVTPHAGMTVGVSALGSRIRAQFDGNTRIDLIDGGIPAGHYVGLQGFNDGTGDVVVDNLVARSSAARAVVPLEMLTLQPMDALAGVH